MDLKLSTEQRDARSKFRRFVDDEIMPHANRFDRDERLPRELIDRLAEEGFLAAFLPEEQGGRGMECVTYGHLNEQLARGSFSVQSLLTVHGMVSAALARWGSPVQKERWLSVLGGGATRAAFALTEPEVGSDAGSIRTTARVSGDSYVLAGAKKWISHAQTADLFLVMARCDDRPTAFLVERETPGLHVMPMSGLLGARAAMLGELRLDDCEVPKENRVGAVGFGFSHVGATALDHGRLSVAWASVGIAQGALEASVAYCSTREQFGATLNQHQLVQRLITRMITRVKAARLLCYEAAFLREQGNPDGVVAAMIAKYFASTTAVEVALDAVQVHGANGFCDEFPVARYLRDAKVLEVIEGSTQILEVAIARHNRLEANE